MNEKEDLMNERIEEVKTDVNEIKQLLDDLLEK